MLTKSGVSLLVLLLLGQVSACKADLRSASGVVVQGKHLLLVGDDTDGTLFRVALPEHELTSSEQSVSYPLKGLALSTGPVFGGALATDLEAVALLPDGEPVVLSEGAAALLTAERVVATYDPSLMQFGGRGLEGLDVHRDGRIAALWEGGYPHPNALPTRFGGTGRVQGPFLPAICVHRSRHDGPVVACGDTRGIVSLEVPESPDAKQAFRAPDLIWSEDGSSWIVLLASTNAENSQFRYKWLQRFGLTGKPLGPPLNLCDQDQLPVEIRHGLEGNVEGLAWWDVGKSVVMVNDSLVKTTVVVLQLDPWPETDPDVACDVSL